MLEENRQAIDMLREDVEDKERDTRKYLFLYLEFDR